MLFAVHLPTSLNIFGSFRCLESTHKACKLASFFVQYINLQYLGSANNHILHCQSSGSFSLVYKVYFAL